MPCITRTLLLAILVAAVCGGAARPARAASFDPRFARPIDPRIASVVPMQLREARVVGDVPSDRLVRLNVYLAYPHPDEVRAFDDVVNNPRSPMFGRFLTPAQFVAAFAPSPATHALAIRELGALGIRTWRTWPNRKLINVEAPAGSIERAFGTRLVRVTYEGREHFANLTPAIVPQRLRGIVMHVSGFDDFEMHSHLVRGLPAELRRATSRAIALPIPQPTVPGGPLPAPTILNGTGFAPKQIQTAYDEPIVNGASHPTGTGVTMAIAGAFGVLPTDLIVFWQDYGITYDGALAYYDPDGNVPSPTNPEDGDESTIDIEQSTSSAPGANERAYLVPASLTIMLEDAYNGVVSDATVDIASTSWGSCEPSASAEAAALDDTFEQGASEGQTWFASAGDTGSSDCEAAGADSVDVPADSPEVAAAGGTSLYLNADNSWASENGWACDDSSCDNGAGGGGVSSVFPIPPWQKGITNVSFSGSRVSATMRNVPDFALNADIDTCYGVFFYGTANVCYGGTSFVGPNMDGILAQYEQTTGHRLGRFATYLYNNYALHPTAPYTGGIFHDVTMGGSYLNTNYDPEYAAGNGYPAGTGFDDFTGWGSIDFLKFFATLPVPSGPNNL